MVAIIQFVFFILDAVLGLLLFAIVATAILSWLVAFDVINLRNRFIYSVAQFLEAVTRPVLGPFQRIVPTLGGIDISPIIAILIITGIRRFLLPAAHNGLIALVAG